MAVRIGGQAVIEGVMMKNMDRYAVSVRKPNGKIETKVEECVSFAEKHPLFQLPVFRGMANFLESMVIGMKTLNYSASFYEDEEEQTESRTEQLLEKILGEKAEDHHGNRTGIFTGNFHRIIYDPSIHRIRSTRKADQE